VYATDRIDGLDPRDLILQFVPTDATLGQRFDKITPVGGNGGGGHFSVVFRAIERSTGRDVALKFFRDRGDQYRRLSFDREGRLLWTVFRQEELFVRCLSEPEHLTIQATVPGVGVWPIPLPFIVLEWAPKGSAEDHCTAPAEWTAVSRQLRMFRAMCKGVARLHNLRCAHRDLKPGNFLVFNSRTVKLADFGTAKLIVSGEQDLRSTYTAPVGDRRYTAPELWGVPPPTLRGGELADFFALGAILFEMLTGQGLWNHTRGATMEFARYGATVQNLPRDQRETVFLNHLSKQKWPIPKLRTINPNVPRCVHNELDALIAELAHSDPRQRAQTLEHVHRLARICELRLLQDAKRKLKRMRRTTATANA
jgi:serine/threonine protein kinase